MAKARHPSNPDALRWKVISRGLQRANRFEVFINVEGLGTLSMPAQTVSLPGRSFLGMPDDIVAQGSNPRIVPMRRAYGGEATILLGFFIDQNWFTRAFFEKWADRFYPLTQDVSDAYLVRSGSYVNLAEGSTMRISFLDLEDNIRWQMRVVEPYVSTIIQETYSQEQMNQLAMLNVAIGFKEYIPEVGSLGSNPASY